MRKILGVIFLSLLLSGCASLEGNVFSGMPKKSFCSAKSSGSFSAICNQKFFYYNNGVEVLKKGSEFAVFKNVTAPTLGDKGFSVRYGNGTYVRSVYSWSEAQNLVAMLDPTFSNSSTNSLTTSSSMINSAKSTCKTLGFEEGTDKFTDCALKLYTQEVENKVALKVAEQKVSSSSSSGTMTIYDPVRDRQNQIDRGMKMLSGGCTLGIDC